MLGARICHNNLLDPYLSKILMIKHDNIHLHQTVSGFKICYPATFPICLCQCMVRLGSSWEFASLNFFEKLDRQKCLNPNATFPWTPAIAQTPPPPIREKKDRKIRREKERKKEEKRERKKEGRKTERGKPENRGWTSHSKSMWSSKLC